MDDLSREEIAMNVKRAGWFMAGWEHRRIEEYMKTHWPESADCTVCDGRMIKRSQSGSRALFVCDTCNGQYIDVFWPESAPTPSP